MPSNILKDQRGVSTIVTILLTILIAAGLGAGGYFGYTWWQNQAKQDVGEPQPTTTTPADPRAGWKTYTDQENGFSLKYPPTWTTKEGTFPSTHGTTLKDTSFTGGEDKVFVTVRTNPDADLKTFVEKDEVSGIQNAKVEDLDGFAGTTADSYRVYLGKSTKIYMFTFPGATSNSDLSEDQVNLLTSFTFTTSTSSTPSSSSTDTANWQTYTNTKHSYSFKYPADKYEVTADYGIADTSQGTDVFLEQKSGGSDEFFIYQRESNLTAKAYVDEVIKQSEELGGQSSNRRAGSLAGATTEEFDLSGVYADSTGGESLTKPVHVIVLKRDTDLWIIRYTSGNTDFPAVLTTFKFVS